MDWGHDGRGHAAGRADHAPPLPYEDRPGVIANIRAIAELARDRHGVRAVIHPHAGGPIEFADEIERIAGDVPPDLAGLCLDTGHLHYAGLDPLVALERQAGRRDRPHFEDIAGDVLRSVTGERIRFFEACAQGVVQPIGRGAIDDPAVRALLDRPGREGFVTIEQERDPRGVGGGLADVRASLDYPRSVGFLDAVPMEGQR